MQPYRTTVDDAAAITRLAQLSAETGLDVIGGSIRRSSSRLCLGVEHGDYNGTALFGVATDRFIWMAFKKNTSRRVRLFSDDFREDGVICLDPDCVPLAGRPDIAASWARFPFGAAAILQHHGFALPQGLDVVLTSNIPGGGMSRSASLCLNLILTLIEGNGYRVDDPMQVVRLAQEVENDYVGSPCGLLDQIMIMFGTEGAGTHFDPRTESVTHIPLGNGACDFRFVALDTGTVRPGLEHSTYRRRRQECEDLTGLLNAEFGVTRLADIRSTEMYERALDHFGTTHPEFCLRLRYVFEAQRRFDSMLDAWKAGDVVTVGRVFREDGLGLRDLYQISGRELETMCDIARTVPGVLGERMLGGGDKGAAGALVRAESIGALEKAVRMAYPRSHPTLADAWAMHVLRTVDGVSVFDEGSWVNA